VAGIGKSHQIFQVFEIHRSIPWKPSW